MIAHQTMIRTAMTAPPISPVMIFLITSTAFAPARSAQECHGATARRSAMNVATQSAAAAPRSTQNATPRTGITGKAPGSPVLQGREEWRALPGGQRGT